MLWFRTLGLLVKLGWVWLWHLNAPELLGSLWSNFRLFVKQRSKCITGFFWGPTRQCRENSVNIQRVNNRDETEDPGITMCGSKVTVSEEKGKGGRVKEGEGREGEPPILSNPITRRKRDNFQCLCTCYRICLSLVCLGCMYVHTWWAKVSRISRAQWSRQKGGIQLHL